MEAPESAESDYINTTFLSTISQFVSGLGPEKTYFGVLPLNIAQEKIELIKSYELVLHPWTFRADSGILSKFNNSFIDELRYYYFDLHMDGLFVEFPDIAREVIDEYNSKVKHE
jgi:glycerophosphoryl diester phosphodiesterase